MARHVDLSFIIPVKNEEKHIAECIDAIVENCAWMKYEYEIIIFDDQSTDSTVEIATEKMLSSNNIYVVISPDATGPSMLRNAGEATAEGDVLVFLDGDVILDEKWWDVFPRHFDQIKNDSVVTGSKYLVDKDTSNWITSAWFDSDPMKPPGYINGGHLIMSKNTFHKVSGFDENMETGEDVEFCQRALKKGCAIQPKPQLKAVHKGYPTNLKWFFNRERWHGKGNWTAAMFTSKMTMFVFFYWASIISSVILLSPGFLVSLCLAALLAYKKCGFTEKFKHCFVLANVLLLARGLSLIDVVTGHVSRTRE